MATSIVHYLGALRCECTHLKSGNSLITDAPVDNQGKGEAFSPTDTVATALASCMLTIMGIYVQKKDYDIIGTQVEVTKHMSETKPRKIAKIDLQMTIRSSIMLNNKEKQGLMRAAKTCPVALSLHPDIEQNFLISFK